MSSLNLPNMFSKCDVRGGRKRASVQVFAEMRISVCSLEPEWAAAATEVKEQTKGKVKLAAVDATANQMLTGRYGVCLSASSL